jgi:hypothetical protein
MMIDVRPEPICFLSDARGIYLPQSFARAWEDRTVSVANVSDDDWAALEAGPEHREYWDAWQEVCDSAIVTDINGVKFFLDQQDGGLFLIPQGMTWDDEADGWRWP